MSRVVKLLISDKAKFSEYELHTSIGMSTMYKEDNIKETNYSINLGGGIGDVHIKFSSKEELLSFQSILNSLIEEIKNKEL